MRVKVSVRVLRRKHKKYIHLTFAAKAIPFFAVRAQIHQHFFSLFPTTRVFDCVQKDREPIFLCYSCNVCAYAFCCLFGKYYTYIYSVQQLVDKLGLTFLRQLLTGLRQFALYRLGIVCVLYYIFNKFFNPTDLRLVTHTNECLESNVTKSINYFQNSRRVIVTYFVRGVGFKSSLVCVLHR